MLYNWQCSSIKQPAFAKIKKMEEKKERKKDREKEKNRDKCTAVKTSPYWKCHSQPVLGNMYSTGKSCGSMMLHNNHVFGSQFGDTKNYWTHQYQEQP